MLHQPTGFFARGNDYSGHFELARLEALRRDIALSANVNMTGDRAIEWCQKADSVPADTFFMCICGNTWTAATDRNWLVTGRGTATGDVVLRAYTYSGVGVPNIRGWTLTPAVWQSWHRHSLSLDISQPAATMWTYYRDGVNLGNGNNYQLQEMASTQQATTGYFEVASFDFGHYFDGYLDDLRVYDAQISQAFIQANMFKEIDPATPNLQAYYKMNNDSWIDYTASAYQLTKRDVFWPTFSTDVMWR